MAVLSKEPAFYDFCRMVVHLPVSNNNEKKAANEVISYIKSGYPGLTYTSVQHSPIVGFWSDKSGQNFDDSIAFAILDLPYSISKDIGNIGQTADELKEYTRGVYEFYRSKQIEVWVMVHPILVRIDWKIPNKKRRASSSK